MNDDQNGEYVLLIKRTLLFFCYYKYVWINLARRINIKMIILPKSALKLDEKYT
jgi:hypothetical protein